MTWRDSQAHGLERSLAELVDTIEDERARQFESLRAAAHSQLGLNITATVDALPLHPGRLFWLNFAPPPAIELPGTALLRRHGPGAADRAWRRLFSEISDITDRQVGRARADLQERLGETVRQLMATLKLHHADTLDRLRQMLRRAAEAGEHAAPERKHDIGRLDDRIRELDGVLERLDHVSDGLAAEPEPPFDGGSRVGWAR